MSNKVTVVLKTAKLSPTQKSTFAQHVHVSMLRNANFTAPYVALTICWQLLQR